MTPSACIKEARDLVDDAKRKAVKNFCVRLISNDNGR